MRSLSSCSRFQYLKNNPNKIISILKFFALGLFIFFLIDFIYVFFIPVGKLQDHYPIAKKDDEHILFHIEKERPKSWVPLKQVSRYLRSAIIQSEDSAFYTHHGIDVEQLANAIEEALREKRFVRGASTITQQLVKNIYLSRSRSLWRKLKEAILAVRIEKALSKSRILELYFNVIEIKPGGSGIMEGANHFFHKRPANITPKEAAFIAMILPGPKKNSLSFTKKHLTKFARSQIKKSLRRLAQTGVITYGQMHQELATPFFWER